MMRKLQLLRQSSITHLLCCIQKHTLLFCHMLSWIMCVILVAGLNMYSEYVVAKDYASSLVLAIPGCTKSCCMQNDSLTKHWALSETLHLLSFLSFIKSLCIEGPPLQHDMSWYKGGSADHNHRPTNLRTINLHFCRWPKIFDFAAINISTLQCSSITMACCTWWTIRQVKNRKTIMEYWFLYTCLVKYAWHQVVNWTNNMSNTWSS